MNRINTQENARDIIMDILMLTPYGAKKTAKRGRRTEFKYQRWCTAVMKDLIDYGFIVFDEYLTPHLIEGEDSPRLWRCFEASRVDREPDWTYGDLVDPDRHLADLD